MYKAQAQVLIPIVKELTEQIGEAKTHQIIRKALGDHFRNFGKSAFASVPGETFGKKMNAMIDIFAADGALDWKVDKQGDEEFNFTVTGCQYAEFYKQLGAPELGFMLVCGQDYALNEGMDDRAVMQRDTTIMQGHGSCQFRWHLAKDKAEAEQQRATEQAKNNVW